MRKHSSMILSSFLLILLAVALVMFNGCASGIPQEDYNALSAELETVKSDLEDLEANVAQSTQLITQLSVISAYSLWYDHYYGVGIYADDVELFNMRLGSLIAASGDANSQSAFNVYYEADQAYNAVVAELPTDNSAWSLTQYNSWVDTGKTRADAIGQVGGYLIKIVEQVDWFQIP